MLFRSPSAMARATYSPAPGSGKNVELCSESGWAAAKLADQEFSQAAMSGLCG